MTDRTVHAFGDSAEVVRYDKAGKWYIEPIDSSLPRQKVTLNEAARYAIYLWEANNGSVNFGRPGGSAFDRKVRSKVVGKSEAAQ